MSFELPNLPYALDALAPYISQNTMEFHYGKHHRKYIETTNKLIATTEFEGQSLKEVIVSSHKLNPKLYNNAAQAWNHGFFWKCLTPKQVAPSQALTDSLKKDFETVEGFQDQFTKIAKELFGSGWVWLIKDQNGALKIRAMKNAGNPMTDGETPLFTCDVWEHAYYLDYQNERPRFLKNFWRIANWDFIESNLRETPTQMKHFKVKVGAQPMAGHDDKTSSSH